MTHYILIKNLTHHKAGEIFSTDMKIQVSTAKPTQPNKLHLTIEEFLRLSEKAKRNEYFKEQE